MVGIVKILSRRNFTRPFSFIEFNSELIKTYLSDDCVIAFDPTYIRKSGKSTPGVGSFYSGCAGSTKWGLEFNRLAGIDLKDKTALHLTALQTVDLLKDETLLSFYARKIIENSVVGHSV